MTTCYSSIRGNNLVEATLTATAAKYVHGPVEMRLGAEGDDLRCVCLGSTDRQRLRKLL